MAKIGSTQPVKGGSSLNDGYRFTIVDDQGRDCLTMVFALPEESKQAEQHFRTISANAIWTRKCP